MSILRNVRKYINGKLDDNKDVSHIISYIVPINVVKLDDCCFYGCSNLSSITIPDSVKCIGEYCFSCCSNLNSITIPDSVKYLPKYCFSGCSKLTSITIPNSVTSFGYSCFEFCSSLSLISIPISLRSIGNYCFYNCYNLKTIYTNNIPIVPGKYGIPMDCKILPYEQRPIVKPPIEIKEFKIQLPEISEEYQANLLQFNDYIKERTKLMETVHTKSIIKYHESIIDFSKEFKETINSKRLELEEYIKVIQNYNENLFEISSGLTKKIKQHTEKLNEIKYNNYKLSELNKIEDKITRIIKFECDEETMDEVVVLNENYYYKDDLIIPKINNPYTEIYKLPCNFSKLNYSNRKLILNSEKKIALLPIEYQFEYIDLSNSNIQYFIDTFKNCGNLKEIIYPDSTEFK